MAFESLAMLSNALQTIEVGRLGVCSFGKDTQLLHSLEDPFDDSVGPEIFARLTFQQTATDFVNVI